jgi:hypothetical protein
MQAANGCKKYYACKHKNETRYDKPSQGIKTEKSQRTPSRLRGDRRGSISEADRNYSKERENEKQQEDNSTSHEAKPTIRIKYPGGSR